MTSIGIQCNIEHAKCDGSSNIQSVTVQAKNELLHDNDDRDLYKSDLFHAFNRSEADGMSLSQAFAESGETSDSAKQIQSTSQEATINSEHSIPIVAQKRNGEEKVNRQIIFKKDSKHDNKTQKRKPCAVVASFLSDTELNDREETVLKTLSIGDGEGMDIVFNPNMQSAIVRQPDWCLSEASHQESEQIQDNAEDINFPQNSTEPFLLNINYSLPSNESTEVSGNESYLHGAFTDSNCSVLKSDDITKIHVGRELIGSESRNEDKIARDFGDEQSYNNYQNGKIQSQTSNNILNAKDSKGQNVLSSRTHITKRHLRKNTNAQMKQIISRRHRVRMGKPLCKVRFDATILKQHCKDHTRKIKRKGKYGFGNKIPVKDTKKCKSLSNKESLNRTFMPRAGDQLIPLIQVTVAPASELIYCVYFENESRRRQTFRTYDNQDIVERLVRNGFFYSERENQIVCYRCGGRQGRLRDGDIPERAHHSGCRFHSEDDPGNHNEIRERDRNRSMSDNVRLQGSSNSTQASPDMVPSRVPHNVLQVFIDYFRRQNDPGGGRGGRPITVIPPFPFDEAHEHRRHITVLPPRPDMNGRRRRGIIALPPRPPSHEFILPSDGTINHTQSTEAISTPSMPIPLPHRCVFCRIQPVSIRFEPCQHALACYQCSLSKVICTECGKIIIQTRFM